MFSFLQFRRNYSCHRDYDYTLVHLEMKSHISTSLSFHKEYGNKQKKGYNENKILFNSGFTLINFS